MPLFRKGISEGEIQIRLSARSNSSTIQPIENENSELASFCSSRFPVIRHFTRWGNALDNGIDYIDRDTIDLTTEP
jgi:hypothetical protein